jgi:hypothetical protein
VKEEVVPIYSSRKIKSNSAIGKRKANNNSYNNTTTAATHSGIDLKMHKAQSSPYGDPSSKHDSSLKNVKSKSLLQLPGGYSPSKSTALNTF